MNKQRELNKIAQEIEQCRECRKGGTGKPVPGEGSGETPVLFIGEAPGRFEAETGRPFVGRSGKFLRQLIRELGLDEEKIFIASPVHYFPVAGKPSCEMIEHGTLHLLKQIDVIKPRVIILLGNTACRALLGRSFEIAKTHGTVVEKKGIHFFITYHPAYAVRFPEGRKNFLADLILLKNLLQSTLHDGKASCPPLPHFS